MANIRNVQRRNGLKQSEKLEGRYNLTVEMETGTGKTYTYIKTMFELYRTYGWSKFIVVVPSIAIREGVLRILPNDGRSLHGRLRHESPLLCVQLEKTSAPHRDVRERLRPQCDDH